MTSFFWARPIRSCRLRALLFRFFSHLRNCKKLKTLVGNPKPGLNQGRRRKRSLLQPHGETKHIAPVAFTRSPWLYTKACNLSYLYTGAGRHDRNIKWVWLKPLRKTSTISSTLRPLAAVQDGLLLTSRSTNTISIQSTCKALVQTNAQMASEAVSTATLIAHTKAAGSNL